MYKQTGSQDDPDLLEQSYWSLLTEELDQWLRDGHTATFWWRDDGVGKLDNQLDRLLGLRKKLGINIALSTIPTLVDNLFWSRLAQESYITILQNGYSHHNFADTHEPKTELNRTRPTEHIIADLAVGIQKLALHPEAIPVLVPPWNHITPQLIPLLPEIGYCGLSCYGPRPSPITSTRLKQNNVHIAPVKPYTHKDLSYSFLGAALSISNAVMHLKDRRIKNNSGGEVTGLLSQHAVQDENTWGFIEKFVTYTKRHKATKWISAEDVFGVTK